MTNLQKGVAFGLAVEAEFAFFVYEFGFTRPALAHAIILAIYLIWPRR